MKNLSLNLPGGFTFDQPNGIPRTSLSKIIQGGVSLMLLAAVVLSLIFLIISGIQWITSGGDKQGIEQARSRLIYSIVGLFVALAAFVIINIISAIIGVSLI